MLYCEDGKIYTSESKKILNDLSPRITLLYQELLDKGYSPIEVKDMLMNLIFEVDLNYKLGL